MSLRSSKWLFAFAIAFGVCLLCSSCKNNNLKLENGNLGVYQKMVFKTDNGALNYRVFYPENFDSLKKYPLLLFMHGAGERGDDNESQLVHGSELIAQGMNKYNGIAIFPQCPAEDYWVRLNAVDNTAEDRFSIDVGNGPTEALGLVIELVNEMKMTNYVDSTRMYAVGLSMGGMATYDLLWRMPNTFAAAMPICGAGAPEKASFMKSVPMRIFHGEDDEVVSIKRSIQMEKAIISNGGNPTTFYYPGINHDSWTNAFAEEDFLSWLFAQKM